MVHRSPLAITLALALAACGQSTQAPAPTEPAAVPQFQWTSVSSGEGAALALQDGAGATVLNLACLYAPERMRITVASFTKIGSEERLSFGADDEPFVFVAQLEEAGPGVAAEREVSLDLVERLLNADVVSANYGAQNAGPFAAPPRDVAETFAATCREIAG
ncbi:MAG: hypothetical protein K2P70_13810 [Hyphomonadaceae bacterium]|nr:hypothetical protein [Hyphomonadaceae bacterium]